MTGVIDSPEQRALKLAARLVDELGDALRRIEALEFQGEADRREAELTAEQLRAEIRRLKAELARKTPRYQYIKTVATSVALTIGLMADGTSLHGAMDADRLSDSVAQIQESCDAALESRVIERGATDSASVSDTASASGASHSQGSATATVQGAATVPPPTIKTTDNSYDAEDTYDGPPP